jgi:hypothetical protein
LVCFLAPTCDHLWASMGGASQVSWQNSTNHATNGERSCDTIKSNNPYGNMFASDTNSGRRRSFVTAAALPRRNIFIWSGRKSIAHSPSKSDSNRYIGWPATNLASNTHWAGLMKGCSYTHTNTHRVIVQSCYLKAIASLHCKSNPSASAFELKAAPKKGAFSIWSKDDEKIRVSKNKKLQYCISNNERNATWSIVDRHDGVGYTPISHWTVHLHYNMAGAARSKDAFKNRSKSV